MSAWKLSDLHAATQVGIGVALSGVNILFYAIITAAILSKKNIAWILPVIVIKYLILISAVYYVWASTEVLKVVMGIFSELILAAFVVPLFKRLLR
ncbi:MAG: hypothetical protein H6623_03425 [Bdellovibrionaceae bacterium]|nr:hypothetical protein [Pseudobdellovibrionaceae bacterium]